MYWRRKKKCIYFFCVSSGINENKKMKKKTRKKKGGAYLSWAIAQLYCKKEICIAILVLYCNLRCVLDGLYCNIVFLAKNCIAREGLRAGKKKLYCNTLYCIVT